MRIRPKQPPHHTPDFYIDERGFITGLESDVECGR